MTEIQEERRRHRRYSLELHLRYKVLRAGMVLFEGIGKTRDMSTTGLCFVSDHLIPAGAFVEISIDWPIRLSGIYPLALNLMGTVTRSDAHGVGVRTTWREFETEAARPVSMLQAVPATLHMM